ncbi:hypothetical protein FUAX_47390 (plasmid) [Fulvitalea axinellae]|uniref:Uncharacterized protein n=1 Tax=Fulvitalea axinellae TaxID=1182444 RepID=A0AAU9D451_9BACT|nr:hypothetical protein FUAX_47390 [Fulvitalea axinellae]
MARDEERYDEENDKKKEDPSPERDMSEEAGARSTDYDGDNFVDDESWVNRGRRRSKD